MKEYYSRLLLKDGASLQEVKKAYRKMVKKFHPDKNESTDEYTTEFRLIQEAYDKLCQYLEPKKTQKKAPQKEAQKPRSTETGIVKNEAKYAEAGEEIKDESLLNLILTILFIVFVAFYIAAIYVQDNLIIKAVLIALMSSLPIGFILNKINSKRGTEE